MARILPTYIDRSCKSSGEKQMFDLLQHSSFTKDWVILHSLNLSQHSKRLYGEIDFLLLDPPRTGAESRVISGIVRLKPKRICYVSCDPATLARDLKKLIAGGYSISSFQAFDMFPQTHHIETVVHLSG